MPNIRDYVSSAPWLTITRRIMQDTIAEMNPDPAVEGAGIEGRPAGGATAAGVVPGASVRGEPRWPADLDLPGKSRHC